MRRKLQCVCLFAAVALLGLGASSASAAQWFCYYLNGSCSFGSMSANTPSPWTGLYFSQINYMRSGGTSQQVYMTVQVRKTSTYSWSSSAPTTEFGNGYVFSDWQHRCYHSGPNASISAQCSFYNP